MLVLVLAGGWAAVNGPRGLRVLLEKREEIRRLQEENAALEAANAKRRERIQRLEENQAEQELEIRKQLHLQRQNETTFILPDKTSEKAPDGTPESSRPSEQPADPAR
jgi:cell division protein FtsB